MYTHVGFYCTFDYKYNNYENVFNYCIASILLYTFVCVCSNRNIGKKARCICFSYIKLQTQYQLRNKTVLFLLLYYFHLDFTVSLIIKNQNVNKLIENEFLNCFFYLIVYLD